MGAKVLEMAEHKKEGCFPGRESRCGGLKFQGDGRQTGREIV